MVEPAGIEVVSEIIMVRNVFFAAAFGVLAEAIPETFEAAPDFMSIDEFLDHIFVAECEGEEAGHVRAFPIAVEIGFAETERTADQDFPCDVIILDNAEASEGLWIV